MSCAVDRANVLAISLPPADCANFLSVVVAAEAHGM